MPAKRRPWLLFAAAVIVGAALGSMVGSRVAGTDEPLPPHEVTVGIARMIWPEREIQFSEEPGAYDDLSSQGEHEDFGGYPGWVQVILGDATQDRGDGVSWMHPPGWVESHEMPYVFPETPAENARRRDDAAARLAADGWAVTRPWPDRVVGRKGTLVVELFADDDGNTPSLDLYRVPPPSHGRLAAAGAIVGALLGAAGAFAVTRHRRRFPDGEAPRLVHIALGLLMLNSALVARAVYFAFDNGDRLNTPLWRSGRFMPLGACMNVALLLLVVGGVLMVRRYRMNSSSRS
ncbi:hypothetical protein Afil01_08030 [Actinorhabdospora filicis]|uniref:Uncharacterized protein n=1 Tax=Actinorhabdospora filicis TaxID=1785913 RepID=A0A9W6W805_9ACTN|nr:hypothetical protein [Actinorhabdospora filicis]GLZ75996.1 hypothetical protein Afil01_08030 [Actinorhabdospora filicis]